MVGGPVLPVNSESPQEGLPSGCCSFYGINVCTPNNYTDEESVDSRSFHVYHNLVAVVQHPYFIVNYVAHMKAKGVPAVMAGWFEQYEAQHAQLLQQAQQGQLDEQYFDSLEVFKKEMKPASGCAVM
eukprot:TRINITY_DN2494_c0_g1_i3.p1 TRINITY_DN2494_c0_g1~~TRINITY_DN2494_c0_g1_i3.p1  ORF type:complete len:127 (-),score=26.03 TRINITY_DN2494_c0_g1_i3:563-943(-)